MANFRPSRRVAFLALISRWQRSHCPENSSTAVLFMLVVLLALLPQRVPIAPRGPPSDISGPLAASSPNYRGSGCISEGNRLALKIDALDSVPIAEENLPAENLTTLNYRGFLGNSAESFDGEIHRGPPSGILNEGPRRFFGTRTPRPESRFPALVGWRPGEWMTVHGRKPPFRSRFCGTGKRLRHSGKAAKVSIAISALYIRDIRDAACQKKESAVRLARNAIAE